MILHTPQDRWKAIQIILLSFIEGLILFILSFVDPNKYSLYLIPYLVVTYITFVSSFFLIWCTITYYSIYRHTKALQKEKFTQFQQYNDPQSTYHQYPDNLYKISESHADDNKPIDPLNRDVLLETIGSGIFFMALFIFGLFFLMDSALSGMWWTFSVEVFIAQDRVSHIYIISYLFYCLFFMSILYLNQYMVELPLSPLITENLILITCRQFAYTVISFEELAQVCGITEESVMNFFKKFDHQDKKKLMNQSLLYYQQYQYLRYLGNVDIGNKQFTFSRVTRFQWMKNELLVIGAMIGSYYSVIMWLYENLGGII